MKLIKYLKELTIVEFLIIIVILLIGSGHYYIKNLNQAKVNLIENEFQSSSVVNNVVRAKINIQENLMIIMSSLIKVEYS
jgi:hypothetical protein